MSAWKRMKGIHCHARRTDLPYMCAFFLFGAVLFGHIACNNPTPPVKYENWEVAWRAHSNYFVTMDSIMLSLNDNDVMISIDNGIVWKQVLSGFDCCLRHGQIAAGGNNGVVFVNGDAYVSSDGGIHWQIGDHIGSRYIAADTSGNYFAVSDTRGLIASTDLGRTWKELPNSFLNHHPVSISIDRRNRIIIGADSGIYRSTDGGAEWMRIVNGIDSSSIVPANVTSFGAATFAGLQFGVYRSNDGGSNWVPDMYLSTWPMCMNRDGILLGVDVARIARYSIDTGKTWRQLDPELYSKKLRVNSIGVNSDGFIFIGASDGNIYKSIIRLDEFVR